MFVGIGTAEGPQQRSNGPQADRRPGAFECPWRASLPDADREHVFVRSLHHDRCYTEDLMSNQAALQRALQEAQRRAEADYRREVERVNRENQRRVDAYNREVDQHNQRQLREQQRRIDDYNRRAEQHNQRVLSDYNSDVQRVNAYNQAVITDLNRQLRAASSGPRFTVGEQALADRVLQAGPCCW
jgi:hypothetical protein